MSQSQPEQVSTPESGPVDAETGPIDIGSDFEYDSRCGSSVARIQNETDRNDGVFRPVYTGLETEDIEVELVSRVPAENSPHQGGHLVVNRPEWDEPRNALPENVEINLEENLG